MKAAWNAWMGCGFASRIAVQARLVQLLSPLAQEALCLYILETLWDTGLQRRLI